MKLAVLAVLTCRCRKGKAHKQEQECCIDLGTAHAQEFKLRMVIYVNNC